MAREAGTLHRVAVLFSAVSAALRFLGSLGRYAARGGFARSRRPLFVVGCGHSGTTLTRAILGRHPDVHAVGYESNLFVFPKDAGVVRRLASVLRRDPYAAFGSWQDEAGYAGKARWVEQTPRHVRALPWLLRLHPRARVVMVVRDPRDVVASLMERGYGFERALHRWQRDNAAVVAHARHRRCTVLRYEDLVTDPEHTLERVSRFCGLAYDPGTRHPTGREPVDPRPGEADDPDLAAHHARRRAQVRSSIFDGRDRWKADLAPEEAAMVLARTASTRTALGYA